ncbi:MAG: GIY-YIG nuclease family protein, partial [Candidatus Falkowbacteria bacterium]
MAKTIKIFLVDGEPNGLKTAELSNWVGQAIVIPRNKLKDIKQRPDCNKPAIYFLVGKENEEALLSTAYIGEAENLWNRLITHDSSKDFWFTAIAFVSKDNNLTKAHVKYLESKCIEIASRVKRYNLENGAKSVLPTLSEADIAEMEEFLSNLKLLLTAVGYPILQEIASKEQTNTSDPLFTCGGKMALASGRMTNEGFVVYKDSTATTQFSSAVAERNSKNIEKLILNGYLEKKDNDLYIFTKDFVFNSPSAASDIILGNSTS